jgi:hypothetical protein
MKISEILVESKQLDEGPLLNKIGSAVGKGVGAVGKGVGAVAGGVAGFGAAVRKGYRAGKATVASGGDYYDTPTPNSGDYGKTSKDGSKIWNNKTKSWEPYDNSTAEPGAASAADAPAAGAAPANAPAAPANAPANAPAAPEAGAAPAAGAAPTAQQINKAGPKGTAVAKAQTGKAGQALAKTTQAVAGQDQTAAGQTMYAQVKANVDKLDKKGKQRIMQLLQKSLGAPAAPAAAAAPAPAPKLGVAPTMSTVTKNWDAETGEPLTPKAKAEYAKFSPEQKAEIEKNKAARKPARATQAEIDADRERIMGSNSGESIARTGKVVAESFSLYRKH